MRRWCTLMAKRLMGAAAVGSAGAWRAASALLYVAQCWGYAAAESKVIASGLCCEFTIQAVEQTQGAALSLCGVDRWREILFGI